MSRPNTRFSYTSNILLNRGRQNTPLIVYSGKKVNKQTTTTTATTNEVHIFYVLALWGPIHNCCTCQTLKNYGSLYPPHRDCVVENEVLWRFKSKMPTTFIILKHSKYNNLGNINISQVTKIILSVFLTKQCASPNFTYLILEIGCAILPEM